MKTKRLLAEPKTLYRVIEDVFAQADDRLGGRRLLTGCARAFLEAFGHELGVDAAVLYSARLGAFERQAVMGIEAVAPPPRIAAESALGIALGQDRLVTTTAQDREAPWPGRSVGLLVEEPRARHALFLHAGRAEHLERILGLAGPLRAALSARILQNRWGNAMREAAEIQRSLLPARAPGFPGYEIAARSQPAEEVGGDVYDLAGMNRDTLGFFVADASGHGLPAALVARDVLVGLRMGLRSGLKATRVIAHLNEVMHEGGLSSSFVSAFYGELGDDGTLLYVNAGHPAPLLCRATGIVELAWGDTVLGPAPGARFRRHVAHLAPGDVLVTVTDGILERRSAAGTFFGLPGLERALEGARDRPADETLARVFAAAGAHGDGTAWEDDATVLVIRRKPPQPPQAGFSAAPGSARLGRDGR